MNVFQPLPGWNVRGYSYAQRQTDNQLHPGADLNVGGGDDDLGLPVISFADGTVVERVDWNGATYGYGNALLVQHSLSGLDLWTLYAHLDGIHSNSVPGYIVKGGEELGWCGKSGFQTWAHLHFEIRYQGPPAMPLSYWGGGLDIESLSNRYADPYSLFKVLGSFSDPPADSCEPIKSHFERFIRELQPRQTPCVTATKRAAKKAGLTWADYLIRLAGG